MKIALIAHCLHPIREPFEGGLEMVTYQLCRSLMERGHDVHLYAHRDSDTRFNLRPIPVDRPYPGGFLSEVRRAGRGDSEVREELAYARVMNDIAVGGYDIVHNHSLHHMPILMGNGMDVAMLTSIHTPAFTHLQLGAYGVEGTYRQTFTMVSESLARTWEHIVPDAQVVHNGIDLSKWGFVRRPSGNYLFWYGRICPEKGTHLAIGAALRSGREIRLAGPVSNPEYYDKKVAPMLSDQRVKYLGHLSQRELRPVLANAVAMLFTSTWEEPYGLTLAESLACGTPVVAFEGGATPEILTRRTGIIVGRGDVAAMSDAVRRITGLDRADCRERAEDFCSHQVMVDNYIKLYGTLLEQRERKKSIAL